MGNSHPEREKNLSRVIEAVRDLHREIDVRALALAEVHAARLQCRRGCHDCCQDDLHISAPEAERIRRGHASLLATGVPGPVGACAFLDESGACRIYADRPSVCRSQGLPLRVLYEDEAGEIVERRDICPLNLEGGPPLAELDEEECWLVGTVELDLISLADDLAEASGGEIPRVALRSLFARERAGD